MISKREKVALYRVELTEGVISFNWKMTTRLSSKVVFEITCLLDSSSRLGVTSINSSILLLFRNSVV